VLGGKKGKGVKKGKGKGAYSSLWIRNLSQSYGASPAIWDLSMLPATRHRWTRPALTPAMQAGTRFTYPGGIEGWVDLGVGYIPRWFTCPSSNHLIATRPGVIPTTSRSQFQRPNRYNTNPPNGNYAPPCTLGGSMAQWLGRWLMIKRSRVRLPASPLPSNSSGQVVHTHVPMSPSSIIWYRPKGGDALRLGR